MCAIHYRNVGEITLMTNEYPVLEGLQLDGDDSTYCSV